jgi:hypothetical protein
VTVVGEVLAVRCANDSVEEYPEACGRSMSSSNATRTLACSSDMSPGWPGAHSQGESLDELQANLQEVVRMLLEDGEPKFESEFVAVQTIKVA